VGASQFKQGPPVNQSVTLVRAIGLGYYHILFNQLSGKYH
jgi:hypothetical protein